MRVTLDLLLHPGWVQVLVLKALSWGLTSLIKSEISSCQRLRHGGSVGAGLLGTIKKRVHRGWGENPSFLQSFSAVQQQG